MRQSILSLCTLHKMLCRYQKCWTVARAACGQTVINMGTCSCEGVSVSSGKAGSKLMKIFLAKSAPFFSEGNDQQRPQNSKRRALLGQTHGTTKLYL